MPNKSDIRLIIGADPDLSYKQLQQDIDNIVEKLNDKPIKIKLDIFGSIGEDIKAHLGGIKTALTDAFKSIGNLNVSGIDEINSSLKEMLSLVSQIKDKSFNITNAISFGRSNKTDVEELRLYKNVAEDLTRTVYNTVEAFSSLSSKDLGTLLDSQTLSRLYNVQNSMKSLEQYMESIGKADTIAPVRGIITGLTEIKSFYDSLFDRVRQSGGIVPTVDQSALDSSMRALQEYQNRAKDLEKSLQDAVLNQKQNAGPLDVNQINTDFTKLKSDIEPILKEIREMLVSTFDLSTIDFHVDAVKEAIANAGLSIGAGGVAGKTSSGNASDITSAADAVVKATEALSSFASVTKQMNAEDIERIYSALRLEGIDSDAAKKIANDFASLNGELQSTKVQWRELDDGGARVATVTVEALDKYGTTIQKTIQYTRELDESGETVWRTIESGAAKINYAAAQKEEDAKKTKAQAEAYRAAEQAIKDFYDAQTRLVTTDNDVVKDEVSGQYYSQGGAQANIDLANRLNETAAAYDKVKASTDSASLSSENRAKLIEVEARAYQKLIETIGNAERRTDAANKKAAENVQSRIDSGEIDAKLRSVMESFDRLSGDGKNSFAGQIRSNIEALQEFARIMGDTALDGKTREEAYRKFNETLATTRQQIAGVAAEEKRAAQASAEAQRNEQKRQSTIMAVENALRKAQDAQEAWNRAGKSQSDPRYKQVSSDIEYLQKKLAELHKASNKPIPAKTISDIGNAVKKAENNIDSLNSKFKLTGNGLAGVLRTYVSGTRIMMAAVRQIRQMVDISIELDKEMTQLQIVTKASNSEMNRFGDTISETAQRVAISTKDLVNATTTFARLGYTMEESTKLAEITGMLQNVGDIDAASAQDAITSIVKAFDVDVSDIESVADKLVTVGNNFPISVSQIAEGMTNASSTLKAAGNNFDESVALLTAANVTVQNAAKASTGLRTIAARLRNTKTDLEELGEDMTEAKYDELVQKLTELSVSLTDVNGEYRSTYDILRDISAKWDDLSTMEQSALATAISGTRQQAIFFSIIDQFREASDAMDAMSESAGELDKAYSIYLDSVEAHINKFKTTFQELSQDVATRELINGVIDLGTNLLNLVKIIAELVNVLGGAEVVLPTLLGVGGIPKLVDAIGGLAAKFTAARTAGQGILSSLGSMAGLSTAAAGPVAALAAAVGAVVLAYNSYKQYKEDQRADAVAAGEEYARSTEKAEEYKKKIYELKDALENGNLSEEEAYEARKNLVSLKDEIQDFYGREIEGLDLLKQSADEAAASIDGVTAAIAERNLADQGNRTAYTEAVQAMEQVRSFTNTRAVGNHQNDNFYLSANTDNQLTSEILRILGNYSTVNLDRISTGDNGWEQWGFSMVGTAREVSEEATKLYSELKALLRQAIYLDDEDHQAILDNIMGLVSASLDAADDVIKTHGKNYESYIAQTIVTDADYARIQDRIESVLDGIDETVANHETSEADRISELQAYSDQLLSMYQEASNLSYGKDDNGIKEYLLNEIKEAQDEIDKEENRLKLRVELDQTQNADFPDWINQQLSHFLDKNGRVSVAKIMNVGLGDTKATNAQKVAFSSLASVANSFGLTVEDLIEVLKELKYIEEDVTETTKEARSAFDVEPVNNLKDSISALKSAFDNLADGKTYSAITAIQEKFGGVSGIDDYISRLLDAGTESEKLAEIMNELVAEKLQDMAATGELAGADERLVAAMLKEAGVANSDEAAHEALAVAKAQVEAKSIIAERGIDGLIESLKDETKYTDLARKEMLRFAMQMVETNNTGLDLSGQIEQLFAIANAAGVAAASLAALRSAGSVGSTKTRQEIDMNARDPFGNPINVDVPDNALLTEQEVYNSLRKKIAEATKSAANFSFSGDGGGGGSKGGGGGGGSSVEKYIADIDRFYEALKRVEAVEQRISTLQSRIDTSEDTDERIELTKQLINSYKEEATAMEELNRQRSEGIQGAISDLQNLGFVISYNAETHELLVQNMEHLNELEAGSTEATNELRKETEELIKDMESWNSANQQTEASLRGVTSNIREARDAMVDYLEQAVSRANEMVDGLQNVYDTLTNTAKEYAENGFLSVDSLQAILALGPKYMDFLVDENGQLVINEENLQRLIAARTEEMAAETALSYAKQILLATETGEIETLIQLTQVDIAASNATWDMAYATLGLAKAIGTANGIQASYYDDAFEYIKKMQSVTKTAVNSISSYYETLNDDYVSQKDALDQILKATQDMIKWENEQQIKGLEQAKKNYDDIIDQKKELIQLAKEQAEREKSVQDKLADIAKLQAKIAQLSLDDSREAQAQKSKLEEELAELQKSLADEQAGYSTDAQINALDKQKEAFDNSMDQQIEGLRNMLQSAEQLYQAAIGRIEGGWNSLYGDLMDWNYNYGNTLQKDLVNAWDAASAAVQRYGSFVAALEGTAGHTGMGEYDNNPPGSDSYTNYDSSSQANESIAKSIVARMKANSNKWTGSDAAGRDALAAENERLGAELAQLLGANVYRDQNGVWWINGQRLYDVYHKGGIVGNSPTRQQDEVMALLQKGEAVLDSQREKGLYKIVDFVSLLSQKLGSALDSGQIGRVFGSGVGAQSIVGKMAALATPQLADTGAYRIDKIEVNAPVYVTEKLTEDDIRKHAEIIGSVSAKYIEDGFVKRGVRKRAALA